MKTIFRNMLVGTMCASTMALTGCLDETFPTSGATADQLASSSKATEALMWEIPAFVNNLGTYDKDMHFDWGYGSIMHMRDVMTADMAVVSSGYNWYSSWSSNTSLGNRYVAPYMPWAYYYKGIQTANNLIGAVDEAKASKDQLGYLGVAHTFRALYYLEAAQLYEFLPSDKYQDGVSDAGKSITNLTVPVVTEKTSEAQARNNPRATRDSMLHFIIEELDKAEAQIPNLTDASKTLPHLGCVYGLKARTYLWVCQYDSAYAYAMKAINLKDKYNNFAITTQDEWLSTTNGFNDLSCKSWMWGSQTSKEDAVVKTGIANWTSWMSNETLYGYSCAGPFIMIASALYNKIDNNDFRKLSFKAPATSPLSGSEPYIDEALFKDFPTYSSLKFRPGQGNTEEATVGSACAFPMMRYEEMFFIAAEAAARLGDVKTSKTILSQVMSTRNPNYSCKASTPEDMAEEVFLQKRIEFFGEGITFFDYKRLNKSVDRTTSTNWDATENFKTDGRPAWMVWTIPYSEGSQNHALADYMNPDPSNLYVPVAK